MCFWWTSSFVLVGKRLKIDSKTEKLHENPLECQSFSLNLLGRVCNFNRSIYISTKSPKNVWMSIHIYFTKQYCFFQGELSIHILSFFHSWDRKLFFKNKFVTLCIWNFKIWSSNLYWVYKWIREGRIDLISIFPSFLRLKKFVILRFFLLPPIITTQLDVLEKLTLTNLSMWSLNIEKNLEELFRQAYSVATVRLHLCIW